MSKKFVRTLGKVAGAVAAVAAIGTGIGAALGGTMLLTIGGAALSASAIAGAASALSVGASLLGKQKPPTINVATQDRLTLSIDVHAPRILALGTTALGTDLRDQEFTGADKEYLHRFVVVAAHKVHAIKEIWFDDQLAWTSSGGVTSTYAGYLTVTPILEGTPANAINISSRMGSARRFTGCAYVHFRFKLTGNSKKTESPFAQQVPTRLTIEGDAIPCYDPRQDSTVPGGSGSHRAGDQSTWTWGDHCHNLACQYATYLLGWHIRNPQSGTWLLSVGAGTPPDRIDWPSFIEGANLCDEPVALAAGGTEPRYWGGGVVADNEDPPAVTEAFKAAMNADVDDQDGLIRLTVFHNDLATPDAVFTEADVENDYTWRQTPEAHESFNVVRGKYVEPATLYQLAPYRDAKVAARGPINRVHPADFRFVQRGGHAERLAKQKVQREQYGGEFRSTFLATGWKVQKNSVVVFSFAPEGFSGKVFRVAEYENARADGRVPMALREEHPQIYAWDAEESPAVQLAEPTEYLPGDAPIPQFLGTIEEGADVTGNNTSLDTVQVGGVPAEDVLAAMDATLGDLSAIYAAIDAATGAIDAAEGTITDLLGDMAAAQASILTAQGDISTLTSTVATLGSTVDTQMTAISNAEGDLASLTSTVSAQGSAITTNANAISTLTSNYASLSSTVSTLGSTVSTQATAISDLNANYAGLTQKVGAGSMNLIANSSFENGMTGWTVVTGGWVARNNALGTYAQTETEGYITSPRFEVVAGWTYTVSADLYFDAAAGSLQLYAYWFDASDVNMGLYTPIVSKPAGEFFTFDSAGKIVTSGVAPPGAAYGRVYVNCNGTTGLALAAVRAVKVEIGSVMSPWSQEATVTQQWTALATLDSQYASLSSTVSTQGVTVNTNSSAIATQGSQITTLLGKWGVKIEVDGVDGLPNVTGVDLFGTGSTGLFRITNAIFQLISQTGRGLTYNPDDGVFWVKGTAISVMLGDEFGTDSDLMFWIGPNPASPAAATKAAGIFWVDKTGIPFYAGGTATSNYAEKTYGYRFLTSYTNNTWVQAGSVLTVYPPPGSSSVSLSADTKASTAVVTGGGTFTDSGFTWETKWQYSADQVTWSDISGATNGGGTIGAAVVSASGTAATAAKTGLTAGAAAYFRIAARRTAGTGGSISNAISGLAVAEAA